MQKPEVVQGSWAISRSAGSEKASRSKIDSALVVPLTAPRIGCVGVLNLSRRAGLPRFNREDLHLAHSIAGHVALAIENCRLIESLRIALAEAGELRDRIAAVLDSTAVGVVVFEPDGSVAQMNPNAAALLSAGEWKGMRWTELADGAPPALRSALSDAIESSLRGERREERASDEATGTAWTLIASPIPSGGGVLVLHDITNLERATKELERMRRLAEIGQMAATIAHEIRNPLTGIRGAAQVLRDDPNLAQEFAAIIERETLKLNAICDDFLDFARPLRLEVSGIRLSQTIESVVESLLPEFESRGVEVTVRTAPNEPIIEGDALRLEQVVHNLLRNALEATSSGGTVKVEIGAGVFRVSDDGSGMDSETIEMIFAPFFTTKAKGTGLGLSSVRKILDAHGATVGIRSQPGKGSTFTVTFPRREAT